jgi:hypothetical protein
MFTLYFSYLAFFVAHFGSCGLALAYMVPAVALFCVIGISEKVIEKARKSR